jgi:hypothetical protein
MLPQAGYFQLGDQYSRAFFVNETLASQGQQFSTNTSYTGTVDVTRFDTLLREVSGTFEFEAENQANNFVTVRSGSFDLYF